MFLDQLLCHSNLMRLEDLHFAQECMKARAVVGW